MQKVFIANFGRQNYAWPECLARSSVATMNSEATHPFWVAGDREGFVGYQLANSKTAAGIPVTKPVASRWFNLMTIISQTEGDIWFHREKEQIWWTKSKASAPEISLSIDPTLTGNQRVYICHKPCSPWSNYNAKGNRLEWNSLHPRAKEFLFTEGTLQQLGEDNADYARALIAGEDLSVWHGRPSWKAKFASSKTTPVSHFNAIQRAAVRMAMAAFTTAAHSNGQEVKRTIKNKEIRFTKPDLERYLVALMESQEGLCALTDLPLQMDGQHEDAELLPSLDRIDSDGHYEEGNLQVVCRFANRWKNDDKDLNFRRLIHVVRGKSFEPEILLAGTQNDNTDARAETGH